MNIINLTPHVLNVVANSGKTIEILPSGKVARCTQTNTVWDNNILVDGTDEFLTINNTTFGQVVDLPEPEEGTLFVVSSIVKSAVPNRNDVLRPGEAVRDAAGKIIGCKGLAL